MCQAHTWVYDLENKITNINKFVLNHDVLVSEGKLSKSCSKREIIIFFLSSWVN